MGQINNELKKQKIVNIRVTYKKASMSVLEALTFNDVSKALIEISLLDSINECVIIQTCNRVEIYFTTDEKNYAKAKDEVIKYWLTNSGFNPVDFYSIIEEDDDIEAIKHLSRLAAGLESMVIGENQILNQVRQSYFNAINHKTVNSILKTVFEKAMAIAREVRLKTNLSKGAISIGSIAVDMAKNILSDLNGKKIVIVGAGEIGSLVGKALASQGQAMIFIANRTFERALALAKLLGGVAIQLDRLDEWLIKADVVFVATSAPHYILTKNRIEKILQRRAMKKLIIIDLSQPRNVEETVKKLPYVELYNLDDLQSIATQNLKMRLNEVPKAEAIINEKVMNIEKLLSRKKTEELISNICYKAEKLREKELKKALKMLKKVDSEQLKIINDLTRELVERILYFPIAKLREASDENDESLILAAQKLFDLTIKEVSK
jgi:glutamyl-tRNA reductase